MRRWFLSRFYRLGFGGWFDPPTRYVDKEPVPTTPYPDEVLHDVAVGDVLLASFPSCDSVISVEVDP